MYFSILVFDVVVVIVLVTLVVAAPFETSQFLGFVCNLYGDPAAGVVAGVDIILVGVLHFGKTLNCFVSLFYCKLILCPCSSDV